ncbi:MULTISPECIES: phospholipase D-like domain-containing protein [Halomonadaceae]|uniref:phospholipase D-like domain-containing protein n=1 Tax=Halomonadaceae TaxID=28256 RepID=UPI00159734FD|nr:MULTISPECIES: phospholipase D-like domain-containing protein [Halomonas]QJQ95245.1 phospholipase [Halomonas sp. PA5]
MSVLLILALGLALLLYLGTAWWHSRKPLPSGLHLDGAWRQANNLALLFDESYLDSSGTRCCRQSIFDEIFRLIAQARRLVVIDIFQFNDPADERVDCHRQISIELRDALLARKRDCPGIEIVVITDAINSVYGGRHATHLDDLCKAGVHVVVSDRLAGRDANPSWTALWRLLIRPFGNSPQGAWLVNPLGPGKVTLRSYLAALNFSANHRKTLVVDQGDEWTAVVSSANADDGSSAYRDVALRFSGDAVLELLASELEIAALSGLARPPVSFPIPPAGNAKFLADAPRLRVISEGAISNALLSAIAEARPDERIDLEVLYLSHRRVIAALREARKRGVTIRVLLDPNDSAFGRESAGMPNQQAAGDLVRAGITVRWSDTHGEQAHSKLLLRSGGSRPALLLLGSANYTRRSLDDLNFEVDVELVAPADHPVIAKAQAAFERHWYNLDGERHSVEYGAYADSSRLRYWRYRAMEASGWSTF